MCEHCDVIYGSLANGKEYVTVYELLFWYEIEFTSQSTNQK